jgi:hypothetical protein
MPSFEWSRQWMGKAVTWTVQLAATGADGRVVGTSEIVREPNPTNAGEDQLSSYFQRKVYQQVGCLNKK